MALLLLLLLLLLLPPAHEAAAPPVQGDEPVLQIGGSTQLFTDDAIVASMTSTVTRTMHSPAMSGVAIQADQPWEQGYFVSGIATNILHEANASGGPGKLRLWYGLRAVSGPTAHLEGGGMLLAYAESTDQGRSFTKPLLNQFSFRNSTANNIVMPIPTTSNGMGIFVDPNEPAGSPQRYDTSSGQ